MKIAFDATFIRDKKLTGVEKYILNILENIQFVNKDFSLSVFIRKGLPQSLVQRIEQLDLIEIPSSNRILIDQYLVPKAFVKSKAQLIHYPVFGLSPFLFNKSILTIHDATFWKFPNTISSGGKYYYKPLMPKAIEKSHHIITVSNSSREDILQRFGNRIDESKISVIYEALDEEFNRKVNVVSTNKIQFPYILSVGTLEPRKNLKMYIQAFAILKQDYNIPHKLVLTGRQGWESELNIPSVIKDDIIFTGYVSDDELVSLYKGASFYVFPSLYEGFGFPLLEALACKIPVLASATSSLVEIGGQACLYADPTDINEWVVKSLRLLKDDHIRSELLGNCSSVLNKFSWREAAGETVALYRKILSTL